MNSAALSAMIRGLHEEEHVARTPRDVGVQRSAVARINVALNLAFEHQRGSADEFKCVTILATDFSGVSRIRCSTGSLTLMIRGGRRQNQPRWTAPEACASAPERNYSRSPVLR